MIILLHVFVFYYFIVLLESPVLKGRSATSGTSYVQGTYVGLLGEVLDDLLRDRKVVCW